MTSDKTKYDQIDPKKYMDMIEKLEEVQKINNLILEGATDYIYQLDLVKNICTFSPHALEVLPLEEPTFGDALETCLSFIVPEDRQVFLDSFTPFLTGVSEFHKAEYRVITKQGNIMWICCNGKGLHDENGVPLMIAGSLMDVTEKKAAEAKINSMLYFDTLTGLRNRYGFDKDLEAVFSNPNAKGSVVYLDIRNFKKINEIFGHGFGNEVIKELVNILKLLIPEYLGVYRLSGVDFIVHLPFSDEKTIRERLMPLLISLKQPKTIKGHIIYITLNMGVAIYPTHGKTSDDILKNANVAMISGIKDDKEEVPFYLDSTSEMIAKKYKLEQELRAGVDNNFENFYLQYQPVVDPKLEKWIGAEALLRFVSPTYGLVPVEEVIEILESTTLILPVGKWVVRNAMLECLRWHQKGLSHMVVHVNCSAIQTNDFDFVRYVEKTMRQCAFPKDRIVCELTESVLLSNIENALYFCEELKKLGIKIAIDDFGTGYSSLSYLRKLPVDQIKVDKSFALRYKEDPYYAAVISTVNTLAETLDMDVCIEGIETKEVCEKLQELDIEMLQGYYFAEPLEAEEFYEQLK